MSQLSKRDTILRDVYRNCKSKQQRFFDIDHDGDGRRRRSTATVDGDGDGRRRRSAVDGDGRRSTATVDCDGNGRRPRRRSTVDGRRRRSTATVTVDGDGRRSLYCLFIDAPPPYGAAAGSPCHACRKTANQKKAPCVQCAVVRRPALRLTGRVFIGV